jgi:hypothetical protein
MRLSPILRTLTDLLALTANEITPSPTGRFRPRAVHLWFRLGARNRTLTLPKIGAALARAVIPLALHPDDISRCKAALFHFPGQFRP